MLIANLSSMYFLLIKTLEPGKTGLESVDLHILLVTVIHQVS